MTRTRLNLERLETREMPATLVSPTRLTYQDVDGDNVVVTLSKPLLTDSDFANALFRFDNGNINGSNATKQQLQNIDLFGISAATGMSITTVATRSPVNGGDGLAHVGYVRADGLDLGIINFDGDLGRIVCGSGNGKVSALKGLNVYSMGRYGTSTGAPDLKTVVTGKLDAFRVKSDVRGVDFQVKGKANIGSVTIGGSLVGGARDREGWIYAEGDIGPLSVQGDLVGGAGVSTGLIYATHIGSSFIGGSIRGGDGTSSGWLAGVMGMGPTTIRGDIVGGNGASSGTLLTVGKLPSCTIGGSLIGGGGQGSGLLEVGVAGSVRIGGDVRGGTLSADPQRPLANSGRIFAYRIANLTVGGSLIAGIAPYAYASIYDVNGSIRVVDDLGSVVIKGSIIGTAANPFLITARGQATPSSKADVAIGSLTVHGRVEHAVILAGYDYSGNLKNLDAQVGNVIVGGDWIASSLVAGIGNSFPSFGNQWDNRTASGAKDDLAITSQIKSVSIGGHAMGTPADPNINDHYGIVAESVGAVKIGGTPLVLTTGDHNDAFALGITGDFRVREL